MSESKINMSLDDIIKKERRGNKQGGAMKRRINGPNQNKFRGGVRKMSNNNIRGGNFNRNKGFNSERGGRDLNNNFSARRGNTRVRTNTRRINYKNDSSNPKNKVNLKNKILTF